MAEEIISLKIKRRIFEDERFMHEFMKLYSKIDNLQDSTEEVINSQEQERNLGLAKQDSANSSANAQALKHESPDIHSQKDPMQQEMKGLWDKDYVKKALPDKAFPKYPNKQQFAKTNKEVKSK